MPIHRQKGISIFTVLSLKPDKAVDDLLTVHIGVSKIEDEPVAMARDDAISAVVDTLKVDD